MLVHYHERHCMYMGSQLKFKATENGAKAVTATRDANKKSSTILYEIQATRCNRINTMGEAILHVRVPL